MRLSQSVPGPALSAVVDALITPSFDAIMVTEADDTSSNTPIVFVNEAFTALTGYTAEEVLGKSPALLQGPATDRAVLDRLRDDLMADRVFEGEATNYRRDGTPFTMHWRVAPVKEGIAEPKYYIAVQRGEN
jgi:PAS domain S-box-containing protein